MMGERDTRPCRPPTHSPRRRRRMPLDETRRMDETPAGRPPNRRAHAWPTTTRPPPPMRRQGRWRAVRSRAVRRRCAARWPETSPAARLAGRRSPFRLIRSMTWLEKSSASCPSFASPQPIPRLTEKPARARGRASASTCVCGVVISACAGGRAPPRRGEAKGRSSVPECCPVAATHRSSDRT